MTFWRCSFSESLKGEVFCPGDKSISHRALMLGALAPGVSTLHNLGDGRDIVQTQTALSHLGIRVDSVDSDPTLCRVHGRPLGCLIEPTQMLDMGNSGTTARLMAGILSAQNFSTVLIGDDSLSRRPMHRVATPLGLMGADIALHQHQYLPMTIRGCPNILPFNGALDTTSAQVKSAILLAGVHAKGQTKMTENFLTRDHTEKLLPMFGADISIQTHENRFKTVVVNGGYDLRPCDLDIPGDPSSAAFILVAALLTPNSHVICRNIGLNAYRIRYIDILQSMGAKIIVHPRGQSCGDPVGDIEAFSSTLCGVDVPSELAPSLIDEYPILSVAACYASGITTLHGLSELRYKESNRLSAIIRMLRTTGIKAKTHADTILITGDPSRNLPKHFLSNGLFGRDWMMDPVGDHRIAMAAIVMGTASKQPIYVKNDHGIAVSFPDFVPTMQKLGANILAKK